MMVLMESRYKAHRHEKRQTLPRPKLVRRPHVRYLAWGIVCLLVMAVVFGIWSRLQAVEYENTELKQRLTAVTTPATTCRASGDWTANQTKQLSVATGSGERQYFVHTPDSFKATNYYPVVLFYVGRGSTPLQDEAAYNLDRLPAIVVYPMPTVGGQGMTAWEGAPYSSGSDDVGFTKSIIEEMKADLCIDRTRVYAVGMSNGGGFAALLSCRAADQIAAIAIVSGAMYPPERDCQPPRPMPLMSIHGDRDQTVPYYGSPIRKLPSVERWMTMRAAMNGCLRPTTTFGSGAAVLTSWNNCKDDASVQNIRIEGGPHDWGSVSNDVMWRFLSQHSL